MTERTFTAAWAVVDLVATARAARENCTCPNECWADPEPCADCIDECIACRRFSMLMQGAEHVAALTAAAERETALREALRELRINANRLCDRNLGGTYEDDCRRSLKKAEATLGLTPDPPRAEP